MPYETHVITRDQPVNSAASLRARTRVKDPFVVLVAHELRTPLTAILTGLEVLQRHRSDGPIAERTRGIIERQARHMRRLVDDLLDVCRLDQGKTQLCKQRLLVAATIVDAVESAGSLIDERDHTLEVVLPPEPVYVEADPMRLQQILVNLLSNAARYTPPRGQITLILERSQDEAVLRVQDTGIGIAAELLPSIFDLFVQEKNGAQGGLGIGLHLVRSLVRLHGGTITASSPGPGQGSEFMVRLPLLEKLEKAD
jgi:signal transduction histidine kinase